MINNMIKLSDLLSFSLILDFFFLLLSITTLGSFYIYFKTIIWIGIK